jgi:class 3 adenylate cyclase
VPTLVVGPREGEGEDWSVKSTRFIAQRIAGARLVEPPTTEGSPSLHWYGRAPVILEEIGRLLAGVGDEQAFFDRVLATVLFTDIVDSTAQAAAMGDRRWRATRERHDTLVRSQLARYRGREVKTMGDGFLLTFDGPARAVRCAQAIVESVADLGIEVRAGLHTGEIELDGKDVTGIAVAIGARVGALAGPSEVLVSQTIKDLTVGSGVVYSDRGEHELKGVPDRWRLYQATW